MFSDNQPNPRNCSWKGISGILGILLCEQLQKSFIYVYERSGSHE